MPVYSNVPKIWTDFVVVRIIRGCVSFKIIEFESGPNHFKPSSYVAYVRARLPEEMWSSLICGTFHKPSEYDKNIYP